MGGFPTTTTTAHSRRASPRQRMVRVLPVACCLVVAARAFVAPPPVSSSSPAALRRWRPQAIDDYAPPRPVHPHVVLRATAVRPPPPSSQDKEASSSSEKGGEDAVVVLTGAQEEELLGKRVTDDEAEKLAAEITKDLIDDSCEVGPAGEPVAEECADEAKLTSVRQRLWALVSSTAKQKEPPSEEEATTSTLDSGDALEAGWEEKGKRSSLRRNLEVWKKLAVCAFRVIKAKTSEQKTTAAIYARDSLLTLGPTFVKLGQVLSTRTDVLDKEYIDVLKTLQDDVPGFSGARAKEIVREELKLNSLDEVFETFSDEPIAAASLGQVHLATLKKKQVNQTTPQRVAVKVQRAGLKELFGVDLKNLRKLCELLDKVDPKADGADRSYIDVFDESEKLLYQEIDYLNEARNADKFREDFAMKGTDFRVRIPEIYYEYSSPRVLTMEYVDSFKLTDIQQVENKGLDREELAKRTAEAFLFQFIDTGRFHCDPHPGNLCVNEDGELVLYDFGMVDQLKPNVRRGFKKFCYALFEGGPYVSELQLSARAKELVEAVEEMGVLAKGADKISVEQLARFFIRSFKDAQVGKKGKNIKTSLGAELQSLTEAQVFRFPSTFTFIFRAIASIDGIGKGLDPKYDLSKLAQPFVERLIDSERNSFSLAAEATGLNFKDINTAITTPRKIKYLEDTVRAMEQGNLKIRVRSLENERALTRVSAQNKITSSFVLASLMLNVALVAGRETARGIPNLMALTAATALTLRGLSALMSLAVADKKAARYESDKQFTDEPKEDIY